MPVRRRRTVSHSHNAPHKRGDKHRAYDNGGGVHIQTDGRDNDRQHQYAHIRSRNLSAAYKPLLYLVVPRNVFFQRKRFF